MGRHRERVRWWSLKDSDRDIKRIKIIEKGRH